MSGLGVSLILACSCRSSILLDGGVGIGEGRGTSVRLRLLQAITTFLAGRLFTGVRDLLSTSFYISCLVDYFASYDGGHELQGCGRSSFQTLSAGVSLAIES